jgi:Mce-associated membrane protein
VPPRKSPTTRTSRPGSHPSGTSAATVRQLASRARATSSTDPAAPAAASEPPSAAPKQRRPRAERTPLSPTARSRILLSILAVATVALGSLAAWFASQASSLNSAPSAQNSALTNSAATSQITSQARSAIDALFSYNYADPAPTTAAASRWLTGSAVAQYARLFGEVHQEAPTQQLVVTTTVSNIGVETLQGGNARVLVFVTESDRRGTGGATASAPAMLAINLTQSSATWKIDGIDTY